MYKPLQIQDPNAVMPKKPPLNRPSKYKPLGGLYSENCPQIRSKTKQNSKFTATIRLAQKILKRKFPCVDKPLRI